MGQCWGLSTPTAHKGSVRVDLKPQMKKIDLDGALLWLTFGRGVRVLVVAISAVSWYSCRSGVLQLPAGWLSEVQRVYGYYQG